MGDHWLITADPWLKTTDLEFHFSKQGHVGFSGLVAKNTLLLLISTGAKLRRRPQCTEHQENQNLSGQNTEDCERERW